MKIRGLVCICLVLLFMGALFQPGCRIIVDGTPLKGVYHPDTALRCARAAVHAADELTPTAQEPPFRLVPVLCLQYTETDEAALCSRLLQAYAGVVRVSTVREDGTPAMTYTYAAP